MEDSRGQASWLWYPHMNSLTSLVSQAETSEQTTFVRELQGCATPSYLTPVQIRRMGRREAADEMARAVEGRAWRVLALLGVCVRLSGPGSRSVTLPPVWREVGKVEAKNKLTRKLLEKLLRRRGLHSSRSNGYGEVIKWLTGEDTTVNQEKSQGWWLGRWLTILRGPMLPDKSPETRKDSILVYEIQNCLFPGLKNLMGIQRFYLCLCYMDGAL